VSKSTMDADWLSYHSSPRKPTYALPLIAVDHMGRPDVNGPVAGGEVDRLIQLMAENKNFWSKVSCPLSLCRFSLKVKHSHSF